MERESQTVASRGVDPPRGQGANIIKSQDTSNTPVLAKERFSVVEKQVSANTSFAVSREMDVCSWDIRK